MKQSIPITVLTGYLGSGKTTLFNHILHGDHGLKIAVIVNDMGSVNVDEALINQGGFKRTEEKLISMANGCICCTLREPLSMVVGSTLTITDRGSFFTPFGCESEIKNTLIYRLN